MVTNEEINKIKERLINVYQPIEIYLFGSYAWGHPDEESDVDLLIIVDDSDQKTYKRSIPGYQALSDLRISNDIIVYTKEEFDQRIKSVTTLGYKIKNDMDLIMLYLIKKMNKKILFIQLLSTHLRYKK